MLALILSKISQNAAFLFDAALDFNYCFYNAAIATNSILNMNQGCDDLGELRKNMFDPRWKVRFDLVARVIFDNLYNVSSNNLLYHKLVSSLHIIFLDRLNLYVLHGA